MMTTQETKRPNRVTMDGMIWNANQVLSWVLDPNTGGIHPALFGPSLLGIAFINVVEAGFVFSGNVGTGVVMARDEKTGKWSPPSAIGLTGVGWGFMMGASVKDIVYLIYDPYTLKSMSGEFNVKLGTQAEAAIGTWGRNAEATTNFSNKGVGVNIALSYSRGLFGGFSVEGGVLNPRTRVNEKFYGKKKVCPKEILFEYSDLKIPDGTLINQVYAKLNLLCQGTSTYVPTAEEVTEAESAYETAEHAGQAAAKEDADIVLAEDEIKKEAAAK